MHRVPLSAPVRQMLSDLWACRDENSEYVFPGRSNGYRGDVRRDWAAICNAAGISAARLHDLRHSYASILVSSGLSLPVIGALLGHTQRPRRQDIPICLMIRCAQQQSGLAPSFSASRLLRSCR
jgi:integrase